MSILGQKSILKKPGAAGVTDHAELENLEYETSGHTGFASQEELNEKQDILIAGANITIEDKVISANANELDDYAELDATVAIVSAGGTLTIGATNKVISSVKVGQNVNISGYIDVSASSSPTGTLTIAGLPYTCRNGLKYDSELSISVEGSSIPDGYYWSAYVINNTSTIRIRLIKTSDGSIVDASPYITTSSIIRIGGVYNASS